MVVERKVAAVSRHCGAEGEDEDPKSRAGCYLKSYLMYLMELKWIVGARPSHCSGARRTGCECRWMIATELNMRGRERQQCIVNEEQRRAKLAVIGRLIGSG